MSESEQETIGQRIQGLIDSTTGEQPAEFGFMLFGMGVWIGATTEMPEQSAWWGAGFAIFGAVMGVYWLWKDG